MKSTCDCDAGRTIGMLFARLPLGLSLGAHGVPEDPRHGSRELRLGHADKVPAYMPHWFGTFTCMPCPTPRWDSVTLLVVGLLSRVSGLLTA